MMFGWVALLFLMGAYRHQVFGAGLDEYKRIINGSLVAAAAVTSVCYLANFPLSRVFFLLCFLVGVPVLVTGRLLLRRSLQRARTRGALQHRVLIAGTEGHVDEIASVLARESWLGYRVIGALTPTATADRNATASGVPLVGHSRSLAEVAIEADVDVVFLAGGAFDTSADMRRLAWDLEHEDIQVVIAPSVTDVAAERVSIRPVGGMPLIHLEKPRSREAVRRMKRTFDVLGALALILAFSPVFAFAAFRVWRHDRGPVLFRQSRVGLDGDTFSCLKFRTMTTNAEELLARLHAEAGYEGGLFKLEDDPASPSPVSGCVGSPWTSAPAVQRAARPHEPGRPAPPARTRGRAVRRRRGPAPARPPRHDRPVAGLRPLRPVVVRGHPPGPLLRRQLVDGHRTARSCSAPSAPSSVRAAPTRR